MGILVKIFDVLKLFVSALWALQERKYWSVFHAVISETESAVTGLALGYSSMFETRTDRIH
ncbi:hypothetical protein FRX31_016178 [Thalictrum thalictroides]|uniref:Uncharacterized protein n=1 Tax=Thalictrum thalictroides TaxID=46969 RepID=A0A7J6WCY2_THATH|nr:hypothetical protein FRX31_016178 [Thalictrum thalictroides]